MSPILILIGEKDDWTPAEPCRNLTHAARAAGYPVAIKIYPGAHHSFDSDRPVRYLAARINANAPVGAAPPRVGIPPHGPTAFVRSSRSSRSIWSRCEARTA